MVGNDRLRLARAAAASAEPRSRYERIQRLAAQVKPGLRDGDRLLILGRGRSSSLETITAFYELWIPSTAEARSERWDALVTTVVTEKVDGRVAAQIAKANPEYAAIIYRAQSRKPKRPTIRID